MTVCLDCTRRAIWNSKVIVSINKWDPVECEPCQAKGIGCEECEDKNRATWPALCFKHAERVSIRAKARAASETGGGGTAGVDTGGHPGRPHQHRKGRATQGAGKAGSVSILYEAVKIAVDAHADQVDKAGAPYITHPLRVMAALTAARWSEEIVAAGMLHDVVEDTTVTLEDISDATRSPHVASIVDGVTRRRGETYRAFVTRAAEHPDTRLVKRADVADNMIRSPAILSMLKRYAMAEKILGGLSLTDSSMGEE